MKKIIFFLSHWGFVAFLLAVLTQLGLYLEADSFVRGGEIFCVMYFTGIAFLPLLSDTDSWWDKFLHMAALALVGLGFGALGWAMFKSGFMGWLGFSSEIMTLSGHQALYPFVGFFIGLIAFLAFGRYFIYYEPRTTKDQFIATGKFLSAMAEVVGLTILIICLWA